MVKFTFEIQINCLVYSLYVHAQYGWTIWYDNDHVICSPSKPGPSFLDIREYGIENIISNFREFLNKDDRKAIKEYFAA